MKILITGGNGFLGQHLCRFLRQGNNVVAVGKGEKRIPFDDVQYYSVDITHFTNLRKTFQAVDPDVIIHTAAMSKPDECNNNREMCDKVNVEGTKAVVDAAKEVNPLLHLVYTSSDFVLGEGGPHDERALPAPLNYYGNSKLLAEKVVEKSGMLYSIVRPVFMYGETWSGMRSTFLNWLQESLEAEKVIKIVNDQVRTPTYVGDICNGIRSIIEKRAGGLYHLGGKDRVSPYAMAVHFATLLGLDTSLIEPVTAETFKEPVQRAKEGGVLIEKARQELGYEATPLDEGLNWVVSAC
jgi:dTDP-4-dehydrorhamnose reductase